MFASLARTAGIVRAWLCVRVEQKGCSGADTAPSPHPWAAPKEKRQSE